MLPVVAVLHACHAVLGWFYIGSIGFTRLPILYCFECSVCVPRLSKLVHLQIQCTAPMIYTSNSLFAVRRDDPAEMMRLNSAMCEGFIRIRTWVNPIPRTASLTFLVAADVVQHLP